MENVLKFYILNNNLKKRLRQGWLDVKISSERIESIAEHIYGCLILAITINAEYNLNLNMEHILKMLTLHELEEIIIGDYSALSNISKKEKLIKGREAVLRITEGLINKDEIIAILDEFNSRETIESRFAYHIDKLECDFQAKLYDLEGHFDIENEKQDCLIWYGEKAKEIIEKAKCASDIWLSCDEHLFKDDEIFLSIHNALKSININDYNSITNN